MISAIANAKQHFPLRFGAFSRVDQVFMEFGFREDVLRREYLIDDALGGTLTARKSAEQQRTALSPLDVLVHLFIGQEYLSIRAVQRLLGSDVINDLVSIDLIRLDEEYDLCRATVRIEAVNELLMCSDRVSGTYRREHVYSPWDPSARAFWQMLPETACRSFLEVCCGAAQVCLAPKKNGAECVWGLDVSSRVIHFAEFKRRLNEINGVFFVCGDVFYPAGAQTFDRVVARPPYIPAASDRVIFRDGGRDGERVPSEQISQVPRHLTDRGKSYADLLLSDRLGALAVLRLRDMLGSNSKEFDVHWPVPREQPLLAYISDRAGSRRLFGHAQRPIENCQELGIIRFLSVALNILPRQGKALLISRRRALSCESLKALTSHVADSGNSGGCSVSDINYACI